MILNPRDVTHLWALRLPQLFRENVQLGSFKIFGFNRNILTLTNNITFYTIHYISWHKVAFLEGLSVCILFIIICWENPEDGIKLEEK